MRVVSERSDEEVAANNALRCIGWSLRELAANLMRITRGAGRPEYVGEQIAAVQKAYTDYARAAGCLPSSWDVSQMLDLDIGAANPDDPHHGWTDFEYAERDVVKGALQIAASTLVGQRTQEAAGNRELFDGLRKLENVRERNRRELVASSKSARNTRKRR